MKKIILTVLIFGLAAMLSGCGPLIGLFVVPLIPKPVIKAEYEMESKKVLVWVDIEINMESNPALRRELSERIEKELMDRKLAKSVVGYGSMHNIRIEQDSDLDLTVEAIGKRCGADQVLHVVVEQFGLKHVAGKEYNDPIVSGTAQLIDVETGQRLWPTDQMTKAFYAQENFSTGDETFRVNEIISKLCIKATFEITKYFYDRKGRHTR
ncbi:MAG: hypothetical protein JEZ07_01885 [Phycisphaerae bacterium]|nr:hypothetical protein [Phycisphaerae bacterium]